MRYILNKLKTIRGMLIAIGIMFTLVVGLSYGTFIFSTDSYRSTSMLISKLLYGMELTSTGGNETISGKTVSLTSGEVSTVLLKITSLNEIESKYGVSYKIISGSGNVKYSSNTGWLPTGKINKTGVGTYEKVVKLVIEATSNIKVEFTVDGGYSYNDLNEVTEGFTRVTEMYEGITDYSESLKTIIETETTNNIYGGDSINNYLQYPTDEDTTKNIWRIIGYYSGVDGIKIIGNPIEETNESNINSNLTSHYNTLTKKSDFVLETSLFNCSNTTCTTSTYENIGLLTESEYNMVGGVNSYLGSSNFFIVNGSTLKNVSNGIIENTTSSTSSNIRPTLYLQNDVKVTGSGTSSSPYRLSDKGDVIFASATLNGTPISFPKESDPYIPETVTCTNGSVGTWDSERSSFRLTTVNLPTSCVVDFTEGYTVTLNVTNGSTTPVSKVVGRTGTAEFTVTPNSNYKLELESNSCDGTLNNGKYILTNLNNDLTCSITLKHSTYKWAKYQYVTTPVTYGQSSSFVGTMNIYSMEESRSPNLYYRLDYVPSSIVVYEGKLCFTNYSSTEVHYAGGDSVDSFNVTNYFSSMTVEKDYDGNYMYNCATSLYTCSVEVTRNEYYVLGTEYHDLIITGKNCTKTYVVKTGGGTTSKQFIEYVTSDDVSSYPSNGDLNGYHYELVN